MRMLVVVSLIDAIGYAVGVVVSKFSRAQPAEDARRERASTFGACVSDHTQKRLHQSGRWWRS
jgi:hypothetical protein